MVRAGETVFVVITSFARVPAPGEHIMLWLSEAESAKLGSAYGYGKMKDCVPAIVRDTVLRQKDQWRKNMTQRWAPSGILEDHVADLFVEALTTDDWHAKMARWTSGGDPQ